ncbi:MAG: hypothetical protein GTN49_01625 [candidate division Zixibacteria bacterium]|nr:hypothetical protein [candidate division Zixibacteria bacterium]
MAKPGAFFIAVCVYAAFAARAGAGGKKAFVDYYATASTLINLVNGLAADVESLDLESGDFSEEDAKDIRLRLAKIREGFDSIMTYDKHTRELNEGFILYIDKVLLSLKVAQEYRERGGAGRRERLGKLLREIAELRADLNRKIQRDKKSYGSG